MLCNRYRKSLRLPSSVRPVLVVVRTFSIASLLTVHMDSACCSETANPTSENSITAKTASPNPLTEDDIRSSLEAARIEIDELKRENAILKAADKEELNQGNHQ